MLFPGRNDYYIRGFPANILYLFLVSYVLAVYVIIVS